MSWSYRTQNPADEVYSETNGPTNADFRLLSGRLKLSSVASGTSFNWLESDFARYIDATAGNVTGSLPAATGSGRLFLAVKIDDSVHTVTIAPHGGDLIDGASSLALTDQWADCLLQDAAVGFWHQVSGAA